MLAMFCGLRQRLVHCGFIFLYKESTPALLDPQLRNGPSSQFSLKKKKEKKTAYRVIESLSYKTWESKWKPLGWKYVRVCSWFGWEGFFVDASKSRWGSHTGVASLLGGQRQGHLTRWLHLKRESVSFATSKGSSLLNLSTLQLFSIWNGSWRKI